MMKMFQSQTPSANSAETTRRNSAVRIHLATGALLFVASIPTLVTQRPELSLNYVGNVITLVMSLLSVLSAWISYRYSVTRGSVLFISALLLVSLGIPVYANGLGLQSGIIVAVIAISVAATTLPAALAARVSAIAGMVEAAVILADLYLPDFGVEELESAYVNPFLVVVILVFAYYALRQFSNYAFRAKLIIAFVLVAVIAVSAVAVGLNTVGRSEVEAQAGFAVREIVDRLSETLGIALESEIRTLQAVGTQFEEAAAAASDAYAGKSNAVILEELTALDTQWRGAGDTHAVIQTVVNNDLAGELREFQDIYPEHVEVFVTDRYGANFAASNRTSDYYQADEEWWQAAYNLGEGAIYISQPEFDESSATYAILLATPLYYEGELAGILRSTLDVTVLLAIFEEEKIAEVGHADWRIAQDQLLGSETLTPEEIAALNGINNGAFGEIVFEDTLSLVGEQKVVSPINDAAAQAIADLNWSVIFHQDLDQALLPVERQARATVSISMLVMALAVILGYVAAQRIAAPIVNLTGVTSQITQGNLNVRANIQTQDEIGALSESFNRMTNQLQDTLKGLEQRVAERTADLNAARIQSEERARDLQSISEISQIVSSEQRLEILLPLITRLVSEKFGFYHSGIFLVDENRRYALLQAANSEGGQRMLNRGHRLELGAGIVGNVAATGKPRIALDVGADAVFFDNPDLPATRSEMALPLNVRGDTIGALDVQSMKAGEFTENESNMLGILADQVAIAIENARLFTKTQQALTEVRTLYSQYLQKEWKAFRNNSATVGYQHSITGGKTLESLLDSDEIRKALQQGEIVIVDQNESQTESAIVVPIKLRGETIGVLNIKAPVKDRTWGKDEINLIRSVSERLALALENARLFEETNRRAERERLVSEITGKIRSVNDPQAMIQTAMEELRNVLGASRVQVIPQLTREDQ